MAKISYDNLDAVEAVISTNNSGSDIGFFTLKNDNDEAVVRFMYDSVDDFEILTVHDVQLGQRFRKVNCIRDPREPIDNCPLCKSGFKISNRFFIKLIQYNKVVENGVTRIVPQAVIWERHTSYAKTLKSYIENYGPLSDVICKIIRHGKSGDMQTTYEIVPNLSKTVYPDEIYVKDTTLFGTYTASGTIVMNKSMEEMNHFLVNNEFPATASNDTQGTNNVTPVGVAPVQDGVVPRAANAAVPGPSVNPVGNAQYGVNLAPNSNPLAANPAPNYNPSTANGFAASAPVPPSYDSNVVRPRRY